MTDLKQTRKKIMNITEHPDYPHSPRTVLDNDDLVINTYELFNKYNNVINQLKKIVLNRGCCLNCNCIQCDVVSVLQSVDEWDCTTGKPR